MRRRFSRRNFMLQTTRVAAGLSVSALLPSLLACSDDKERKQAPAATPTAGLRLSPGAAVAQEAQARASVLAGDVLDFRLLNEEGWAWPGGWVAIRLHEALFNGEKVYHVRTDASDGSFANAEKLVYVPKLGGALSDALHGELYLFENGAPGQTPIVSTAPGSPDFTPLLRVNRASWRGDPEPLDSAGSVVESAANGSLRVEATDIIVNYPFVKWPGGELPVDRRLEKALDGGPLVSAPDRTVMTVRFKLHQCYPESYYITTDTGAAAMAGMMNVTAAPGAAPLVEAGATEKIFVFGNGLAGFATMGFQPSIFASKAGEPAWSPMWEHVTVMWNEGASAELLTDQSVVTEKERAGHVKVFPGTPETNGESFVVNCPSPIIAPNTFTGVV